MANIGQIVKGKTTENFTQIPNEIPRSASLSLNEKGLLIYLLCLPSDWILYKKNLHISVKEKEGTVDRIFKSLQKKGYIISKKVMNTAGQFVGWSHVVYSEPFAEVDENRDQKKPTVVKPDLGESAPILNTNLNTNTNLTNISSPEQVQEVTDSKIIDLKVTKESPIEEQIIKGFHSLFCEHRTKPGKPLTHKILLKAKVSDWKKDLDSLMRIDKRTKDDLREVKKYLKTSTNSFWRDTIYSLSGLRKNYDQIWDKMEAEKEKGKPKQLEAKEGTFQGNINRITK